MKNNLLDTMKTTLVRTFGKTKLKVSKRSPEILLVMGGIGVVTSTVMACRATLQLDDILEEKRKKVEEIHAHVEKYGYSEDYSEKDEQQELTVTYVKTGLAIAKLYAPAAFLGLASLSCIVASHGIMMKRNSSLAAAYAAVDQAFKAYRKRTAERVGEDVEKEIRYGIKTEEVEEKTTTKNGKEKVEKKTVSTFDPNNLNEFSVIFDDGCIGYTKDPEYNKKFLLLKQAQANEKLKAQGYLFLNDVYKMLGFKPTKAGHVVGWLYDEKHQVGPDYVDFGLFNMENEASRRFINGLERNVILDFNVYGNIYELL